MLFLLPDDQWRQISLPCNPGSNNSVEAVFGDDDLGVYDTDWVLFRYDTGIDNYIKLLATDTLSQNIGYWIVQKSGGEKTLNMPQGSIPASISASAECIESSKGCYEIPFGTESNATQWNMIGYPFKTGGLLSDARVMTDSGGCEAGCTLDIAKSNGIVNDVLWTYNGTDYTTVDVGGSLDPWSGYWSVSLESAGDSNPKLLVQCFILNGEIESQ